MLPVSLPAAGAGPGADRMRRYGATAASWPHVRWLWLPGFALTAAGIFAASLMQSRSQPTVASSASLSLQAWAMWHGNPLLHGWTLSDVSYWTTELPEYALVEMVHGLSNDTVHVSAAITYTLVTILALVLAKGRASGRAAVARVGVTLSVLLAPSLGFGTYWLLAGPDHLGTQVPLLIGWLVLDLAPPRWWVPVLTALVLAWVIIADPLAMWEGVLPLVAVCLVRLARARQDRRAAAVPAAGGPGDSRAREHVAVRGDNGTGRAGRAPRWFELSLIGAAGVAVLLARAVITFVRAENGFLVKLPYGAFASLQSMPAVLPVKLSAVLAVFGADFFGKPLGPGTYIALLHFVGLAAVLAAAFVVLRRLLRGRDRVSEQLALAFAILLVAYLLADKSGPNEAVGLLPVGAALAGREFGARLSRASLTPAVAVFTALALFALVHNLDIAGRPAAPSSGQVIGRWLAAHHFRDGLAGYWNASTITVDTGGAVRVRPVRMYGPRIVTTPSESSVGWYRPSTSDASFVLVAAGGDCQNVCLDGRAVQHQFGRPAQQLKVGSWLVYVYRQNLMRQVPVLNWCLGSQWSWVSSSAPSARACPAGQVF